MTYSIVAYEPSTGAFGMAVASHVLGCGAAIGAVSLKGAVVSQARATTGSPRQACEMLDRNVRASIVGERLLAADPSRSERQLGVVDSGDAWTHTGSHCFRWAGGRTGLGFAVQGNILAGPAVIDAMADRFARRDAPFRQLLIACLAAGAVAGGDARGPQSAVLHVAWPTALGEEHVDLRVDDSRDPLAELMRLEALYGRYGDTSAADELVRMDGQTVEQVQAGLHRLEMAPDDQRFVRMSSMPSPAPALAGVGEREELRGPWTPAWQQALIDWMEVENLELRVAAPGWIDPRVLHRLRSSDR